MKKKLETNLEYPLEAKSLEGEEGHFEGYLSVWDDADRQQDIVDKGAWDVKLNPMPIFYRHHRDEILGAITEFKEDDYGLLVSGDFDLNVQRAREVHSLAKTGILKLSPGYISEDEYWDGQIRHIKRGGLYEASITPLPAHLGAEFTSIKEEDFEDKAYDVDTDSKSAEPDLSEKEEGLTAVLKAEEELILETKELRGALAALHT